MGFVGGHTICMVEGGRIGGRLDERADVEGEERGHPAMGPGALLQQGDLRRGSLLRGQGQDSGIVRFSFEMLETLKQVVEEE
jgi:hypothetical protein